MADEIIQEKKPSSRWGGALIIFMVVVIVIVAGFAYRYFQLTDTRISLAQKVTDLRQKIESNQAEMAMLHKIMDELQVSAKKSQMLSAQQTQMIADWQATQKGDLNKWYVAEAEYLVKLANDNLQFTHDSSLALMLLQQAGQTLQNLHDPSLLDIQKSLATDIANLEAKPKIDITELYLKITAISQQINQLTLPINPLRMENKKDTSVDVSALPWWKIGLTYSYEALRNIVIVRYNDSHALPLVMPEEKNFLYQNLHAEFENAMWGVLHRNDIIYQTSLARAFSWVQQYFDKETVLTKNVLQQIQALQAIHIQPSSENLAATLQLFEDFSHPQTNKMV